MLRRTNHQEKTGNGQTTVRPFVVVFTAVILFAAVFLILPTMVRAAEVDLGLGYATATGLTTTDIRTIIGNIIKGFFALLGLVAVVLILYAGVLWMTSQGNEEKISQAKRIMINAVIGLTIMMAAYAITAFIFRAISGQGGAGGGAGGGGSALTSIYCRDCGSAELGKILEYHYPEAGQAGVPRNTKIAITMKKPLVLSTVFQNYDDKGTYTTADDVLCSPNCQDEGHTELVCADKSGNEAACVGAPYCTYLEDTSTCTFALKLNTDNFKIIPNDSLGAVSNTADKDADFDARYPDGASGLLLDPAPSSVATVVNPTTFDPNNKGQTIVIKPADPIGSSSVDVNYRVALRGGANGVKVWGAPPTGTEPQQENAFKDNRVDGAYFWSFTTSTALDTTPPQITFVGPRLATQPANKPIVRNQLLQIYFDEAVDPTTATGRTGLGEGEGFNWINVEAKCLPDTTVETCPWDRADFTAISGTLEISNRYRTVEFIPGTACEGISENSCGEPVFCLPKNVELRVTVKPSSVDPGNPPAGIFPPNGVTDMVGNSFDGNKNGTGEGPGIANAYDYNLFFTNPPVDRSPFSDTAVWAHHVNDEVDLITPVVTDIVPKSQGNPPPPAAGDDYPEGPSRVPTDQDITVTWSKTMSPSSMIAGTNVYILSREWQKKAGTPVCDGVGDCPHDLLAAPTVVIDAGKPVENDQGKDITVMKIMHRTFFTANDLGWGEEEATNVLEATPFYMPVIRNKVKDDKQNCFYPSQGYLCLDPLTGVPTTEENPSCMNRTPGTSFDWQP